jgi:hypothetical protein
MGANWWTRDYDFVLGNTEAIDTVDERLIHETYTGTGKIMAWADNPFNDYPEPPPGYDPYDPDEGAEWRHLLSFRADPATGAAPFQHDDDWDVDGDGMPWAWELAHGLDPNIADHNGDFDNDGYPNLEEYINELAEWPAPGPIVFNGATNNRYAQITNWDVHPDPTMVGNWQPSKYDVALVNSGTVVVDAVGQHAGMLVVAAGDGDVAQVDVTDGWLLVNDAVVIGGAPTAAGTLNLSGGMVSTPLLAKGDAGEFHFTGGTLHAEVVDFDLVNDGGTIAPGYSPGIMQVNGTLEIREGVLEIEVGGTAFGEFDRIEVAGAATLGGTLKVVLVDLEEGEYEPQLGDVFAFIAAFGGIQDMFDDYDYPELPPGLAWAISPGDVTLYLHVIEAVGLAGDYNGNGVVDAADYTVWRDNLGTSFALGGNGDESGGSAGVVDQADYAYWKANFGNTLGGSASLESVPEPASMLLMLVATTLVWRRGRRSLARNHARQHVSLHQR